MGTYIYKKAKRKNYKKIIHFTGLGLAIIGLILGLYTLSPLLSWEIYLKPAFATNSYASPIPHETILTKKTLQSLFQTGTNALHGDNWLPQTYNDTHIATSVSSYMISIPKLNLDNIIVSTIDTDLSKHLVHFPGTALPPNKGNAAIFGHSTLPQLYDPKDYKTIFANIHNLKKDDTILVTMQNTLYTYRIFTIVIVDAEDTSYLTQDTDASYLSIITCTPPGTTWKRLLIKARLERI